MYAPLLSSRMLPLCNISALKASAQFTLVVMTFSSPFTVIIVLAAADSAEYSASNVEYAGFVCSCDFHINGHGPRKMMYPVQDLADEDSFGGSILYNPAKSAST